MALGHLVVRVAHDGRAVDILGDVPAEALVQQIVFRRGGQILAAAHDMGDAHEMVVDNIGEVVGRQAVALYEHLIVQSLVLDGDVAEYLVMEGGSALVRDELTDNIRLSRGCAAVGLFAAHHAAGIVRAVEIAGILLALRLLAEAAVSMSLLDEKVGVFLVQRAALGLHIGAYGAADVGAFVMLQMALGHGLVYNVHCALYETALIGVFNAQDELAARVARYQIGVQRRAQVANVHISGGRRGKTGTYLAVRNTSLHVLEPFHIFHNKPPKSPRLRTWYQSIYYFTFYRLSSRT